MVLFIVDVAEMKLITELAKYLRGEPVFFRRASSAAQFPGREDQRLEGWGTPSVSCGAGNGAARYVEKVLGVIDHLDEYEWKSDITNMYQLGLYKMKEMNLRLPLELEKYFDYEYFGRLS